MKTAVYLSTLTSTYVLVLFYVCSIAESQLVLLTETQPPATDVAKLQQNNDVGWLLLKPSSVSKVAASNLPTNSLQSLSMSPKTYDGGHHYVVRVRRRVRIPPLPRIGYRYRRHVERDVTSTDDDGQLTAASENSPISYQIPMPTLLNHVTTNSGDDRPSLSVARQFLVNEQNRQMGSAKWTRAAPLPRIGRRLADSGNSALYSEGSLVAPSELEPQDDHVTSAVSDAISATRRAMPLPRIGLEARAAPLPRIGLRAAAAAVAKRVLLLRPMLEASRRAAPLPRIG